jgi:hypothetical protein
MGILNKSDYEKILNYYNIPFSTSDSSKQIKNKAEEILADKLCKCIKKVKEDTNDPDKDEGRAIGICNDTPRLHVKKNHGCYGFMEKNIH